MQSNLRQTSAVIPALNNQRTIQRCIQSLLANGIEEIVVVDGGSKDNTPSTVRSFDAGFKIQLHRNVTPAGRAREFGWRAAKGQFILFLDADAFLQQVNAVELLLKLFSDTRVAGVTCRVACANLDKMLPRMRNIDFSLTYPERFKQIGIIDCISDLTMCGIFRRDMLEAVGGFDTAYEYAEDLKLLWELTSRGYRVLTTYHPAVYHYHRERPRALLSQFYHHGTGRRTLMKEIGKSFHGSRDADELFHKFIKQVRGKDLIDYTLYKLFTEAAFLIGYSRRSLYY